MKGPTLFLVMAFGVSAVNAQQVPFGTAGGETAGRGPELRQLSRVAANRVPTTWSGCGTAKVDGILSPGEWSGAASHVITVNTASGPMPATLYVMNDNLTLYVAIQFPESSPNYGSLAVEFDNNNNGVPFEAGDDVIVENNLQGFFDDYRAPCPQGACAFDDASAGGTTEGRGAYHNDETNSVYEVAHPLGSFDFGHDLFACIPGVVQCQPFGFFVSLRIVDGSGAIHATDYPGFGVYDQVTVQSCAFPVLSGCGTSTVDGHIGSAEWSGAGQYRLSVNATPSGDTASATLFLMNDSFNLYMGLAWDAPALAPYNAFNVFLDAVGGSSVGDDFLSYFPTGGGFFDSVGVPCPPGPFFTPPCTARDIDVGGTTDGAAAVANDGSQSAFELSHPLSGDPKDVSLAFGDTIPYRLSVFMAPTLPPLISGEQTMIPSIGGTAPWLICTPGPTQSVNDLTQNVNALDQNGALSPKNADTLNKDLAKANGDLQVGKLKQASNDFGNFVNDVTKMMRKGDLADRYGQPLIAAANSAMAQLSGK